MRVAPCEKLTLRPEVAGKGFVAKADWEFSLELVGHDVHGYSRKFCDVDTKVRVRRALDQLLVWGMRSITIVIFESGRVELAGICGHEFPARTCRATDILYFPAVSYRRWVGLQAAIVVVNNAR